MDNIYGLSEHERNSIVQIPDGYSSNAGNTLYSWLGSLWRSIHQGDEMVRGMQESRGVRLAQMYIDILEAAMLKDRNGIPVFHRELWHPIVIRRSQRNKAQENLLTIGDDSKAIGAQPPESDWGDGTVFEVGRMANYANYVTYPMNVDIAGGAVSIVDNIINPTVFLKSGTHYKISNKSIIFHKDNDPLSEDSAFDKDDLPNIIDNGDGTRSADTETVLWASDVLIDRNYIAEHLSYALGAVAPSSDTVKRILNAAWSATSSGLSSELVQTLLAAMLNIPVIQNEEETVVDIGFETDASYETEDRAASGDGVDVISQIVHTDKGSYRIPLNAKIRSSVYAGARLRRGSLLDESLRIYSGNDILTGSAPTSSDVKLDIPSIVLPPAVLRARTERGVFFMWKESVVKASKDNPDHLYFDVGGSTDDVAAFWSDVWLNFDTSGVKMPEFLGWTVGDSVRPAEFVLRNLVGANTLFVVVDRSQVDDDSMMRNPMFFDMLSDVIPSAIRLFLVEHMSVGGNEDQKDLGGDGDVNETTLLAAALPEVVDDISPDGESVLMRFVRPRPARTRGRKGEQ